VRWLATGEGELPHELTEQLTALRAALEAEQDVALVFGSELAGATIGHLVAFGSKLPGTTRYMALGDYANSRGAADMGVLPDRLPGYAYLDNKTVAEALENLWDAKLSAKPGLTAPQWWKRRSLGTLKALYVVGANPLAHFARLALGAANCSC